MVHFSEKGDFEVQALSIAVFLTLSLSLSLSLSCSAGIPFIRYSCKIVLCTFDSLHCAERRFLIFLWTWPKVIFVLKFQIEVQQLQSYQFTVIAFKSILNNAVTFASKRGSWMSELGCLYISNCNQNALDSGLISVKCKPRNDFGEVQNQKRIYLTQGGPSYGSARVKTKCCLLFAQQVQILCASPLDALHWASQIEEL